MEVFLTQPTESVVVASSRVIAAEFFHQVQPPVGRTVADGEVVHHISSDKVVFAQFTVGVVVEHPLENNIAVRILGVVYVEVHVGFPVP